MKSIYNTLKRTVSRLIPVSVFAAAFLSSCADVVEKTDLSKITDDAVWNEPGMIRGYFDNTMNAAMPGFEHRLLGHADECFKTESGTSVAYNSFDVNKADGGSYAANIDRWPYEHLRKINRFLDHVGYDGFVSRQPATDKLSQAEKENMTGQMLVLRAYHYFDLVRTYGGVPLLLHEQTATSNFEELYTARSKTSECVAQIVKDLDAAIALPDASFPMKNSDGHISKAVAYALKGRVLLYYASPQFTRQTPAGTKTASERWAEAYAACKEAYDKLTAAGFGLYAPEGGDRKTVMDNYYKMLITEEMNCEMIWVRRYHPLIAKFDVDKDFRPMSSSGGGIFPVWEMVAAFSNADGTPFTGVTVDNSINGTLGAFTQGAVTTDHNTVEPDGSPINKSVFWLDREPRFYAFIGYNGCEWSLIRKSQNDFASDLKDGKMQHEWLFSWGIAGEQNPFSNAWASTNSMGQGFFIRKFVSNVPNYEITDPNNPLKECGTDWPLFRFAEVMLNLAEAAAKTGKLQEAYDMLDAIRKRAGIPAANNYGIGRKTGDALILDILNERRIELFVESKRYYDARRWDLYKTGVNGYKINGMRRHAIMPWLRDKTAVNDKPALIGQLEKILEKGGIDTDEGREEYFKTFFHAVMLYDIQAIDYDPVRQDFLRIPYETHIMKNPTIKQTKGWTDERGEGTFDPYE
ncbi:MAG: RagB/SusD family nutrient uptake outer membrane protein [Prevotellaceae bacterium]|jgi:hypothetical protein|nr:RagB/SusD family nutrient uptake outer membrane protein [Prevotellaceae bacterium]